MGKGIAVVGVVAAVAAALAMLVLVGAAAFLVVPVLLAGCIGLALQRTLAAALAAILLLVLTILATLGLAGSVTTEGGTTDFGLGEQTGRVLAVVGLLAIPLAVAGLRWDAIAPRALAYVGVACGGLAAVLAVARPGALVDQSDPLTIVGGLLALGAIAPMVGLLRAADEAPAEPASTIH